MRTNPDGSIYTWTVTDRESGDTVLVDDRTFDPERHQSDEESPRDARRAELKKLSAADLKAIAAKAKIEFKNKGQAVDAIVAAEFPES